MSVLLDRQFLFTRLVCQWGLECFKRGYFLKLRETGLLETRTVELDGRRPKARDRVHSGTDSTRGGTHYMQLSTDVELFYKDGNGTLVYITDGDDPRWVELGELWESLDPLCRWGGRFGSRDSNHISITYEGRA